jgi:hypothetical protein
VGFESVDHEFDHTDAADSGLSKVIELWSRLPPAIRAGILAMVEASDV